MSSSIVVSKVESIQFHGDELHAIRRDDGQVFAPLKRLCEALGLDADSQARKLKKKHWACTVTMTVHDTTGRNQDALCLSLKSVPMWLATIDASRVANHARAKLDVYQRDCADVLAAHFGADEEPSAPAALAIDAAALVGSIANLVSAFGAQQAATEARLLQAQAASERRLLTVIEGLGRTTPTVRNALRMLPGGKSRAPSGRQEALFPSAPVPESRCKPNWFVRQTKYAAHVDGNPGGCHRRAEQILRGFGARPDADGRYERSYLGAFKAAVDNLAA